jgi:RNA polymerase sigma factor (sigma-70 family)
MGDDALTDQFERMRPRLHAIAYRMLGSLSEADDAVQEGWLRLTRVNGSALDNLDAWLTTVVARVSLDMLRSRRARREEAFDGRLPEPVVTDDPHGDPEQELLMADSVGLALLVVLQTLTPAERLAFVLHDMFAVPFDEIAPLVDRSPEAARKLASRARRRVRGAAPSSDTDLAHQRVVVDAFLAAAREGDFEALIEILDPDVVFRIDTGGARVRPPIVGAQAVARRVVTRGAANASSARPVVVNGAAGVIVGPRDAPTAVVGFTVSGGRIVEIDLIADPARLAAL